MTAESACRTSPVSTASSKISVNCGSACASDCLVNPVTAARAYRELGDVTETRRGIGLVALDLDPKELLK
jgi:hypothetical protein